MVFVLAHLRSIKKHYYYFVFKIIKSSHFLFNKRNVYKFVKYPPKTKPTTIAILKGSSEKLN